MCYHKYTHYLKCTTHVPLHTHVCPKNVADDASRGTVGGGGTPSLVSSTPVRPRVTDVPLTGVTKAGLDALRDTLG